MSTFKHFDSASGTWVVDAAGNASNIELNNEILQDEEGKSISVHRGFQKINNRISKLEHNLAWIYQNGAKGGSGSGGGSGSVYTITVNGGKTVFYTSGSSITISLTISSGGQKKNFTVTARDINTGKYLVSGETHQSMTPFDFTISGLTESSNQIYLQAYDSSDNYTELVQITVNVGSVGITKTYSPDASYTIGGTNQTASTFQIQNKTGSAAYLLMYQTSSNAPLKDALAEGKTAEDKFGALSMTTIPSGSTAGTYTIDYVSYLQDATIGSTIKFKVVLYSPTLDYTSDYFTDQITITSGDALVAIIKGLGINAEEASNYLFATDNFAMFNLLLYYEKIDITTFYYRFSIYNGDTKVYNSETLSGRASATDYISVNFPTDGFEIGNDYKIVLEACNVDSFETTDSNKYSTVTAYFGIKAGQSGVLKDYAGLLLARFGSFNFPSSQSTAWNYTIPETGDYAFTSWPVTSDESSRKTTLNIINGTTTTGAISSDSVKYLNLSGNTYATIDRFAELLPEKSIINGTLFTTGFYIQVTYKYLSENPVDQCILSLGTYRNGSLWRGFEINSDYIKLAFGTTDGLSIDTPVIAENAYPSTSTKTTETVTVGLNVWSTAVKTSSGSTQNTYYFAIYIDGTLTKCLMLPEDIIRSANTSWLLGQPLYLGCRSDLTNQANCDIYDVKIYAQNQPDLSIVWNYMSAVEQAHLVKSSSGEIIIDEVLDSALRKKNLFNSNSNNCLLCDSTTGEYLTPAAMYSLITENYTNTDYDLNYPVVYLEDISTGSSDMYQCLKATWTAGQSLGNEVITDKKWPVRATITTKYGKLEITGETNDLAPQISIQGTSSLSYNSKNLEFNVGMVNEATEKLLKINGWIPENEFTLKADVVDSAHVNNVAIGSFVNNSGYFVKYPGYAASDPIKSKVKNTSEGFPCLIFIKYSNNSVDEGLENGIGKTEFLGVYNFNLGRYAYYNLGLKTLNSYTGDEDLPDDRPVIITDYTASAPDNVYSMEISDNFGKTEELFTQADTTITDLIMDCRYTPTSDADANKAITNTLFATLCIADASSGTYNRKTYSPTTNSFEDIIGDDGNPKTWSYNEQASNETQMRTYLDTDALRKYFVLAMTFGLVDSVCKNMVFRTWNATRWYPAFYDMDTAFKMDNRGSDTIPYDAFPHRYFNELNTYTEATGVEKFPASNRTPADENDTWKYYYAGMCSETGVPNRIWKVLDQYDGVNGAANTIGKEYWTLRNTYIKDPDTFINDYFSSYINKTGSIMYNYDYREKYVSYGQKWDPSLGLVADTSSKQTEFLYGTRVSAVRAWFKKRINFLDSVYSEYNPNSASSTSYLDVEWDSAQKAAKTSTAITLAANQKCKIKYQVSSGSSRYLWLDETSRSYILETQSQGNLWYLYGAGVLTDIPNFNNFGWYNITKFLNFKLLKELNLSNLEFTSFTGADNLADIDAQTGMLSLQVLNMSGTKYSGTIGLTNCELLKELYLNNGCTVSAFTLPTTGTLEILDLTNNTNIAVLPASSNNVSILRGQSGLKILRLAGTSLTDLSGSNALADLPSLQELTLPNSLTKLTLSNCGLKTFSFNWTDTTIPSNLTELTIIDCPDLESISLENQTSLKTLSISGCPNLKSIDLRRANVSVSTTLDFTTLPKLESLNISDTTLFTNLDLTNCPNLNSIQASNCSSLTTVKCTYDVDNPIELGAEAFRGCSALTTLEGNFLLQGPSVFEECSVLIFDTALTNGTLNINFDKVSDFSKTFRNCKNLGSSSTVTKWPEEFIHRLNSEVSNISEMFYGTTSNFMINRNLFSYVEEGVNEPKDLNVTNITGIFQNTQLGGYFFSESDSATGLFHYMPNLLSAERAFADSSAVRYIDNNFFQFPNVSKLVNVDYMFQNNYNLTPIADTNGTDVTETPLHTKNFFIELVGCIHSENRSSGITSVPNPDWPYPFAIFSGSNVKMVVDLDKDNKPYLFHLKDSSYKDKVIYLENNLYSGVHLQLDSCDYSYLFGGGKLDGAEVDKTVSDGETTYYIPKFRQITSPFEASEDLKLDLSGIDGNIFFAPTLQYLNTPFSGMVSSDTSTIPDTIFKGAQNVKALRGIFAGLKLTNTSDTVFDFAEHDIFAECTSLEDISSIFANCVNFRMRLASGMFKNCKLKDVSSAFAGSRVIEQLPEKLFYMTDGTNTLATIEHMSNVFVNCYNLGYDANYEYAVKDLDLVGTTTTWYDHVVMDESTKLSEYTFPEDFFWYCKANCDIEQVLGQMFWPENTVEEQDGGVFKVVESKTTFIGPMCKIPSTIFSGSIDFKNSTNLKYAFAGTHFLPENTMTDTTNYTRVNQYPEGLFYGMTKLKDVTGIFANTVIDAQCQINSNLFTSDSEGTICPLTRMTSAWSNCLFTYKVTQAEADPGSAQLDFSMFNNYSDLEDVSGLFENSIGEDYGLRKIDSSMFSGINQKNTLKSLNISSMFAYNNFIEACEAPLFSNCNLTSGKRTYLLGISPTMISNWQAVKSAGLHPDTEEWNNYSESSS